MTTQDVANRLVELMRMGQVQQVQEELYADDVTSTEPAHSPIPSATGKNAVMQKGAAFAAMIETRHGGSFSDAVVGGRYFSCAMTLDATFKEKGRMNLEEICVFEVKEGKIVSDQFFF
ncbi:MAG: nuclear transport factor 2 family protein [Bacteroidetes bacterium]|nr:nuclear transport factor 2 family protein [Bacteroidota bacterium]